MNFRNQRLGRHLAADYTIIMSRTLKVTGNHVMCDRCEWFLRVITSSSRALCCLPSVKRQKHWLPGLLRWPSKASKNSRRQGLTKHKKGDEGGKGAVCWLDERDKTERTYGIFTRLEINYQFHLLSWPFFFVQCIIKQLLDSVFVISRIIKVFG